MKSFGGFWQRRGWGLALWWTGISSVAAVAGTWSGWASFALIGVGLAGSGILLRVWQRRFQQEVTLWAYEVAERLQRLSSGIFSVRFLGAEFPAEIRLLAERLSGLAEAVETELGRVRKLERVRSDFLGNVSHELRNPLFALRGYLETLAEAPPEDATTVHQFAQKALQYAQRLENLLARLMEISQIETGAVRMRLRTFSVTELAKEVVEMFAEQATQRQVQLHVEAPSEPVEVVADRDRIEQVLSNLVENAIKYNRPGGSVHVRIRPEGKRVRVEVADTGIGIPPEHQERVFERFYRVRHAEASAVEGSGLGLAIVKHILEAHQAPYELESQPGVGTTVRFWLRS
ncbi:MAG: ATP-binding protein [Candidatus Kapabacteria bacterium]|nr:ATP-binding protein [Candidatus Kapabacteria bacterium]MDW8011744.1 ATP-binding protein [Bacteroidota bacterium]